MSVTIEEVEKIARLAKLSFSEEEKIKFTEQFNQILQYMEKLNELDTENVSPTFNVLDVNNVFREDKVKPWLTQEQALQNAPKKKNGLFSVPKVIG
ncbi:Asp-tRNA(Asn)/Glu-tRNA(Gln) amidotransferase subunit GatC [candidate division KSB1 bacterium]|nr:Asp-tRNA(Asn)/Glu-tRNA(Gln) amidotransferase subunit GatC [candidate division KSB1 bacterium]